MPYDCSYTIDNNWFRFRAAAIIIENGCVLFAKNDSNDYYYSVGGGVHMNETAEDAVKREVFEETGVEYEIDHLAVIHENFFDGDCSLAGLQCHEVAFYFLMKPRGTQQLNAESSQTCQGFCEHMHWIPIAELDSHRAYPIFMKDILTRIDEGIIHIVTNEREMNAL